MRRFSLLLAAFAAVFMFSSPGFALADSMGGEDNGSVAVASCYGDELAGNPTASGDIFDPTAFTAAHKELPFGTKLEVSSGGSSVVVTVNDRGPYVEGRDLDLSCGAYAALGLPYGAGAYPVWVRVL